MSPVFLSFKIEMIEQFNQSLVELSDLNLRWTILNLSLHNVNIPVLNSDEFSLFNKLGVLSIELSINLIKDPCMLLLLKVDLALFHALQLDVQAFLLFFTFLFKLLLIFGKTSLFFDQSGNCHDFMLFNRGLLDSCFELGGFLGYLLDLLLVLSFLILQLRELFLDLLRLLIEFIIKSSLLGGTLLKFFDFNLIIFILLLVKQLRIILHGVFLHLLEISH